MTATTALGRVLREADGVHLRFERTFATDVDDLWSAITDRCARWLGRWDGDPATGTVHLTMSAEDDAGPEPVSIQACEPPHRLAVTFTTGDGPWPLEVTLSERDGAAVLVFVHHLTQPYDASSIGPGWQYYLDRLTATVTGQRCPRTSSGTTPPWPTPTAYQPSRRGVRPGEPVVRRDRAGHVEDRPRRFRSNLRPGTCFGHARSTMSSPRRTSLTVVTTSSVDEYLDDLDHAHKAGICALRGAILGADPGISEHVKWNAPSFRFAGEDRATMRLAPRDAFQLVLHRGTRVRSDVAGVRFEDATGLVRWLSPDRGVIDLAQPGALEQHLDDVVRLVRRWVAT